EACTDNGFRFTGLPDGGWFLISPVKAGAEVGVVLPRVRTRGGRAINVNLRPRQRRRSTKSDPRSPSFGLIGPLSDSPATGQSGAYSCPSITSWAPRPSAIDSMC